MRARQLVRGDPISLVFSFVRLRSTREPGVYYPQYVLTVFLFAGFRLVRYVLPNYVGFSQSCILAFIYNLCILHVYECNQLNQFYPQYQLNQYLISSNSSASFYTVWIFFDSAIVIPF